MAIPNLQYRKDLVVMVAWDEETPGAYINWCGATSISLAITNNISEQTVADCDDWALPAKIIRAYGAQSVTATVNASLTRAGRDKLIRAVLDQRELPIRFHLIEAEAGEIEYIDGVGLLPSLNIDNIGSTDDNAVITYTLNISFKDGVTLDEAS
ncbi:phage tail tube protein [Paracoccus denitrificans]|uniref:phage tail tube protein n=1 Tax=Paracoccus denitrificans TaxID=266 RepID=UPI001E31FFA1|nr:phage tail tube protein [Paracoccus denitrificans]UFS66558.1 phage tail tube protein [Paracoccus denitrificans]